jgi:hypothetical protein
MKSQDVEGVMKKKNTTGHFVDHALDYEAAPDADRD